MMMDTFSQWYDARHEYAKHWKERTGGKVLGYFCTYFPEEILYAADVLPVRILGSHEPQDLTEPHIFGMYCPFCRDCLAQGLKGRYDYLDGIGIAQSCLHIRQAFTSWNLHIPLDFEYYLPMPNHVQSPHAIPYLREELVVFKEAVEKWTGRTITDDDLRRGIEIMDANRALMREVYELRKKPAPPITGTEAMLMVVAGQMVDKRDHTAELETVLPRLRDHVPDRDPGERLIIIGSEDDDREFLEMVESLGATFVVDDHCTGSRYFWGEVGDPGDDPLMAIAKRYVERPACPSKDWPARERMPHLVDLAREWGAQGAILIQQKFCDPHELDIPATKKVLKQELDIPSLFLEFDVTVPVGQFKIRAEAFLETLREEDLF
jgi:benzoyl-CoA reductase subunit C